MSWGLGDGTTPAAEPSWRARHVAVEGRAQPNVASSEDLPPPLRLLGSNFNLSQIGVFDPSASPARLFTEERFGEP